MKAMLGVLLVALASCDHSQPEPAAVLSGATMGAIWKLQIADPIQHTHLDTLDRLITARLEETERIFSNWRPDSEVSQINAARTTGPISVSRELAAVAQQALEVARQTGGAFDPTLAPLIDLWGFGPQGRRAHSPSTAEIERARERCGWSRLEVALDPPTLRKTIPGLELNLSAVVEGHALEEIGRLLTERGHRNWLLEIGGEILARGHAPDGSPWVAGIQTPDAPVGELFSRIELHDECLATAGTYRQFFAEHQKRLSHLLDPRTGRPISSDLASVSVVHPKPALADAFATALLVLGRQRGEAIARQVRLRVLWIECPPSP